MYGPRSAAGLLLGLLLACGCPQPEPGPESPPAAGWTDDQLQLLRSLTLSSLGEPPEPHSNRVADDARAARLGRELFFDPELSRDGSIACVSCHVPGLYFTDGRRVGQGLGRGIRNTPTVVGAAYSPWQFWDGRRDSLWSQALAPLEAPAEMGSDRLQVVRYVTASPRYRNTYCELFGIPIDFANTDAFPARASPVGDPGAREAWAQLPAERQQQIDRAFSNLGKAIAAYERALRPAPARFDRYVERLLAGDPSGAAEWLDDDETAGLRLFIDAGRTQCLRCHNGPLLTNQSFHDIATSRLGTVPDLGRFVGIQALRLDVFNCLGPYSDAAPVDCQELRFVARRELALETGAFKTPSLREVWRTAPYFHDGSMADLPSVMAHYRTPPEDPGSELVPLALDDREVAQLIAFLAALSGGVAEAPEALSSVGRTAKQRSEAPCGN